MIKNKGEGGLFVLHEQYTGFRQINYLAIRQYILEYNQIP